MNKKREKVIPPFLALFTLAATATATATSRHTSSGPNKNREQSKHFSQYPRLRQIANEYSAPPGFSAHQKDKGIPFIAKSIEARTGNAYTIAVDIPQAFNFPSIANGLALNIFIDGQHFPSRVIHKYTINSPSLSSVIKSRAKDGTHQAMPIFSDIQTIKKANKATVEKDIKHIKKIGAIEVHLEFINGAEIDKDATEFTPQDYTSIDVAHKTIIKSGQAISHRIRYRELVKKAIKLIFYSHKTIPSDKVIGC
ncbi:hypothetical protein HG530_014538 [Fusarium avenaceum]|nr:hypothetical protein HG530_014538 [Fusarium avenaceum]